MIKIPAGLPYPTLTMQAQSEQLTRLITDEIRHEKTGSISFARFMTLALYEPTLGYYTSALDKFGKKGDFITAPEISPLFAYCLARQCQQVFTDLGDSAILEVGAGTGQLAVDLLLFLEKENALPTQYKILEISASLKKHQQAMLKKRIPHLFSLIEWLDDWPIVPIQGVIIANEVVDALPVDKIFWSKERGVQEMHVSQANDHLVWHLVKPRSFVLEEQWYQLQANHFNESSVYESEVCLGLPAWMEQLSLALRQGLILIIDYGFPASEYYHPDRYKGTLLCYYRHRVHTDPLSLIGLQDITASVNFSFMAQCARQAGLAVVGFTSQAAFLINNGLLPLAEGCYNTLSPIDINRQVRLLTSPNEMGELIKVIGLTQEYKSSGLRGFVQHERRTRL